MAEPRRPPNVVVILADDLGYGDLGCYNPDSKIPTPNLDRLAAQGRRFTDAHAPAAVCTPTRYDLLTGRHCWRTRLKADVLGPWGAPLIEPGRLTLPGLLKQQGYATACVGKWHLGWDWPTRDGKPPRSGPDRLSNVNFTRPIAGGPTTLGFDRYFGVDVPNYPPYCYIDGDRTVGIPSAPSAAEFRPPGPMLPGWKWVDIMPELTRQAVRSIEDAAKAEPRRPFFLYFPLTAPHEPVVPTPEFRGKSRAGNHGDFVVQVDWTVGEVLSALERGGMADDTLVIFTSDNGPEVSAYPRAQRFGHYSMGPLRGVKRDVWEGGHRVPFLARWPGRVPAGTVTDSFISLTDLMATAAALLGVPLPDDDAEDSEDVLPVLLGEDRSHGPAVLHGGSGRFAVRQGDWVLIDGPTGQENAPRNGEPPWFREERRYESHGLRGELYDLREDPGQRHNRYAENPEVVARLKATLEVIRRESRSRPKTAS